jgi:hypothetical protein
MRNLKALNIKKSIESSKLVFDEAWIDKFDKWVIYLLCIWGFVLPFTIFFDPYRDTNKTGGEYYIVFFLSLISIYVLYRKATEKMLTEIIAKSDIDKNIELVNNYCSELGFEKYRNSKNLIIYNSESAFGWGSQHQVSRIFMFKENKVYFTIIKDGFKLNTPVLFSQFILKNDLTKLLRK